MDINLDIGRCQARAPSMPKPNPVRPRRRLSRHEQRQQGKALKCLDPEACRKELLTIFREAPLKIGLCYPNPWVAGAHSAIKSSTEPSTAALRLL